MVDSALAAKHDGVRANPSRVIPLPAWFRSAFLRPWEDLSPVMRSGLGCHVSVSCGESVEMAIGPRFESCSDSASSATVSKSIFADITSLLPPIPTPTADPA